MASISLIPNINAELLISDYTLPIKLHYNHEKFWHISLSSSERNLTLMKIGKFLIETTIEDEESCQIYEKIHESEKIAIDFLKSQIANKRLKGYDFYDISNPKKRKFLDEKSEKKPLISPQIVIKPAAFYEESHYKFNGEFLELSNNFFQIERNQNFLKIIKGKTEGKANNSIETSYHQYLTEDIAKNNALRFISEKIANGFVRNDKFQATFTLKELMDFKESLNLQINSQINSIGNSSKNQMNLPKIKVTNTDLTQKSISSLKNNDNYLHIPSNARHRKGDNYSITSKISDFSDISDEMRSRNSSGSRSPSPNPREETSQDPFIPQENLSQNSNFSQNFSLNSSQISLLGKPVAQPHDVLLAETWSEKIDPTGYFLSEKLDGVRCLWTGSKMYSRNGNQFFCPRFFTENWPNATLDGELWLSRNTFQRCVSIIKKHNPDEAEWRKMTYLVFDAPSLNLPFEARYKLMESELKNINNSFIKVVKNRICLSRKDMDLELEKVISLSGEGLMLRAPMSFYERKRSNNLLKVKKMLDDEALVIGFVRRPQGGIKAMMVRLKNGKEFKIGGGLTDKERMNPPKIGSTVTFKYQNLSEEGIPRFPIYLRGFDKF